MGLEEASYPTLAQIPRTEALAVQRVNLRVGVKGADALKVGDNQRAARYMVGEEAKCLRDFILVGSVAVVIVILDILAR